MYFSEILVVRPCVRAYMDATPLDYLFTNYFPMWTVNNTSLHKRFNTYYSLSEVNLFYIFKINIFFVVSLAYCSRAEGERAK